MGRIHKFKREKSKQARRELRKQAKQYARQLNERGAANDKPQPGRPPGGAA
jgi:hypothetical protein